MSILSLYFIWFIFRPVWILLYEKILNYKKITGFKILNLILLYGCGSVINIITICYIFFVWNIYFLFWTIDHVLFFVCLKCTHSVRYDHFSNFHLHGYDHFILNYGNILCLLVVLMCMDKVSPGALARAACPGTQPGRQQYQNMLKSFKFCHG